jgi:hypothetical protein
VQISINRGPQPRGRRILELQISFKTNSSNKETLSLSSSKEALSKVLKSPSSTLEVYKEQNSIGSRLKVS